MPFYKKKAPTKRRRKPSTIQLVRQPQVIAPSTITTLRYCDFVTMNAGLGSKAYDTWSATSIYDPYVGTGGHQPLGADNWAQFYDHYTVLSSKATATFDVYSTLAGDGMVIVAKVSDKASWAPTNIGTLIEQNETNYKFLTSRQGSRSIGSVSASYNPKKMFSVTNPADEHDLRGITGDIGTGADPTENAYFHFGTAGMNSADDPTAVNVRVVVEYRVLFTERKDLAAS